MTEPLSFNVQLTEDQLDAIAQRVAAIIGQPQTDHQGYLDAAGAAEYLSTTRGRIHDLVQLGKVEPLRDGRRLLFRRADLDAYLEAAG